ncbi:hypothetical protein BDR26DRAFT_837948 [Obelidium mucronatum]|nr:hypothetical protein BDR26DRAFT_837948 [Obelidium mucronatum]
MPPPLPSAASNAKKHDDLLSDVSPAGPTTLGPTATTTGPPQESSNNNNTAKPTSRQRNFHGIHGVYHGQKQENKDCNLSFQVRQAIVDNSYLRTLDYEPEKVAVRTETRYAVRDTKLIQHEKLKRSVEVARCGFRSDPKESYKPLGDPTVDSDVLIYKSLRIDPQSFQRTTKDKHNDGGKTIDVAAANERHKLRRGSRHESGLGYIKQKLAQSKKRIHAVKFGLPFSEACDAQLEKVEEAPKRTVEDDQVDWMNLKIDTEKQTLFQHMHEKHRQAWIEKDVATVKQVTPKTDSKSASSATLKRGQERTMKEIEEELHIVPNPSFPETAERFFTTREKFYEQQEQLNQVLLEDLTRLDLDRKNHFLKKYKEFQIRKNSGFSNDIKTMRFRADKERAQEKSTILKKHAWYFDLASKVTSSGNRRPSKLEELLLDRIRCTIEDDHEFDQTIFIQLMKLIPQRIFNEDAIQRIIRFVKQHSSISERDYLEAIELSNHQMKMSSSALRSS